MRIASGVTDQYVYFVGALAGSRVTGLATWTVYRSRNGAAAAAMTTPTINETDSTNMPGVYELLLDEDMSIGSGNDTEAMVFHITEADMDAVTIQVELYRPKITAGNTLGVASDGDISGNLDGTVATVTTNSDMRGTDGVDTAAMRGTDGAALASLVTAARMSELDAGTAGKMANQVDIVQVDTTTNIPALIAALNNLSAAAVNAECDTAISDADLATAIALAVVQSDTDDLQTRLPAALVGGRMDSDVEAINNNTGAADTLTLHLASVITGATSGTPTTTASNTDLTGYADSELIGRVIIFTGGVANGQASDITGYASASGVVTYTAVQTAPAASDPFVIV